MTAPEPTLEAVRALPKVALHDHLDGGLRPATVVDLARGVGHELPADDADELGAWFVGAASSGSLERFLQTFEHVIPLLQTADSLRRVAREAVLDLAADGAVYAEQRYAPEQHLAGGLTPQQVVDAVQGGITEGIAEAAGGGRTIRVGQIVTALRHSNAAEWTAELALANRDRGVVGFDVAGAEAGYSLTRHESALRTLRLASFPATIHAGEAAGLDSIAEAIHLGGAVRIGHGLRITDDIAFGDRDDDDPFGPAGARLGHLAHWVRDQQIVLELCPTSNVQTGAAASVAEHPITALHRLGFAVTVNTDNRLMCGATLSSEMYALVAEAGWSLADLRDATITAACSAFCHFDERTDLVDDLLDPAFTEPANGRHLG